MRIEAKFTYIVIAIDSRRKIHLEAAKSNLNRSIDAVSVVFRGLRGVFTKPSRVYGLILKVKLSSRLMLLLHARLFAPPLNSNSSISYRISGETFRQCGLSTGASFNRYDRIDSRLAMVAERKKIDRLRYTPPKILLTSQKWRHPLRLLKV